MKPPGLLIVAQQPQTPAKAWPAEAEGVRVVLAQDPATSAQGFFLQLPGLREVVQPGDDRRRPGLPR